MSLSVMKQASDAIINVLAGGDFDNPLCDLKQAALALHQAIAEAEKSVHASDTSQERVNKSDKNEHEWVGLTDDELEELEVISVDRKWGHLDASLLSRAIEAKLKEKNNG